MVSRFSRKAAAICALPATSFASATNVGTGLAALSSLRRKQSSMRNSPSIDFRASRARVSRVLLAIGLLPSIANASLVIIPDAAITLDAGINNATGVPLNHSNGSSSNTISYSSCNPAVPTACESSQARAIWGGNGANSLSLTGSSTDATGATPAYAGASLTFDFAVLGPPGTQVPIHISGSATTSYSGLPGFGDPLVFEGIGDGAIKYGNITVAGFYPFIVCTTDPTSICNSLPPSVVHDDNGTLNATFLVTSDTVSAINLSAVGFSGPGAGSFSATVDPTITIDSTFAANNPDFSLAFSPVLPEPGSLALLSAALVGLGFARRRWRRASVSFGMGHQK